MTGGPAGAGVGLGAGVVMITGSACPDDEPWVGDGELTITGWLGAATGVVFGAVTWTSTSGCTGRTMTVWPPLLCCWAAAQRCAPTRGPGALPGQVSAPARTPCPS